MKLPRNRVELARRLGLRAVPLRCVNSGRSYVKLACRCGRHSHLAIPRTGPVATVDHLLGLLNCACIPPLRDCVTPEELTQLLQGLPVDALHDLRDAMLSPQRESPRQRPTDEGSEKERTEQVKASARDIPPQSRILPEGNELACALHADCAGHEPPTGDVA